MRLLFLQQAVEYYDLMRDPIKTYFIDKIQILLMNKETLRIMIQREEQIKLLEEKASDQLSTKSVSLRNSYTKGKYDSQI